VLCYSDEERQKLRERMLKRREKEKEKKDVSFVIVFDE
jgi:hypothetical protein